MTVIAWDGKVLAADRRASCGGIIREIVKIFRLSDGSLFGASGDAASGAAMQQWIENGRKPEAFPERQKTDHWSRCLVINTDGVLVFEQTPQPLKFEDRLFATGSGAEAALVAMHLGKTAVEAVQIACLFNSDCGNGVDTLALANN